MIRPLWFASIALAAAGASAQEPGSILPTVTREAGRQTTFYGPSGLITVPTSSILSFRRVQLGTTFERRQRTLAGNWGIYPDVEVGGAWLERDGRDGKALANGKVRIQAANFRNVSLGIGVIDAFDAVDQTVYVVASANLVPFEITDDVLGDAYRLRVTAGYGSGLFREHFIGGGEIRFTNDLSILGEWDGTDGNFAMRFSRDEALSVQAGLARKRFFVGFSASLRF